MALLVQAMARVGLDRKDGCIALHCIALQGNVRQRTGLLALLLVDFVERSPGVAPTRCQHDSPVIKETVISTEPIFARRA